MCGKQDNIRGGGNQRQPEGGVRRRLGGLSATEYVGIFRGGMYVFAEAWREGGEQDEYG